MPQCGQEVTMSSFSRKCLRLALFVQSGRNKGKTVVMTDTTKPRRVQAWVPKRFIQGITDGPLAHHGVL